ncbi:MAG: alanine--tRNA ligase [Balneolaceae bacterium]
MAVKTSDRIRSEFLEFFKDKDHVITDSAPVVSKDDPTLLFTNAGMNQFKSIFLGEQEGFTDSGKVWKRAANTQRCIRVSGKHNDLEEVGHDTYHHTLFEMLGNWSFGDYFKKEAINWAWELLVGKWGLDPDRLYATVFEGDEEFGLPADEEAAKLWESETDIDASHILKFGRKDNFWEMGETGPCGPCSEVHIDLRPDSERKKKSGVELVNRNDPRVMEIWNLVFIQFNKQQDGKLEKLPAQHVDTGMGFERMCAVLQKKKSNYDTDVFTPLIHEIEKLSGKEYGNNNDTDIAMRVIADHIRAVSFAIADGASPSNEGRGYVIRRILRRAIRYGWDKLSFKKPFFYKLVPVLADQFKNVFPELHSQIDYVTNVIKAEEQSFLKTLGQGIELFQEMSKGKVRISGENAFKLHDTFGFPIDLTELMAREKGIDVDVERFRELMGEQKERARSAGKFQSNGSAVKDWNIIIKSDDFEFVGYDHLKVETKILSTAQQGSNKFVLLHRSPFYAESGGQIADTGVLRKNGEEIKVLDVQKGPKGYVHQVDRLPEKPEGIWYAEVDKERRTETKKHHTATHLMHAALREVLGDHVVQKGSLVEPERLRFDFSHYEAVTRNQLDEIEAIVNEKIQENIPLVEERNVPIEEAKKRGAMMLFGEKYGDTVRIITFDPDFSVELCGGTHVQATGEIGYFRFLEESSVAAGIRRVEAVSGLNADRILRQEKHLLEKIKTITGSQQNLEEDIIRLLNEKKELDKELKQIRQQQASGRLQKILASPEQVNGIRLIQGLLENADINALKQAGYDALNQLQENSVIVLASSDSDNNKVYLMAAVTDDLVKKGINAARLVGSLGKIVGGGGGGQPTLATAGGRFPDKIDEAFSQTKEWIKDVVPV